MIIPAVPPQRTLDYAIKMARASFGKTDPELEASLRPAISDRLREICSDYDYWFLRVEPGIAAPANFPYTTPPSSPSTYDWIDRGWLLTTPGQEVYPLYVQVDLSADCCAYTPSEAKHLIYVKRFSLQGAMSSDLEVVDSDAYWSRGSNQGVANTGFLRGAPQIVNLYTRGRASFIRLNPVPDDYYILAVSWQLAVPPWYQVGDCVSNTILEYYPRLLKCFVGLEYAQFFKESEQEEYYHREIYGAEMGSFRPGLPRHGIVAQMRKDTIQRWEQQSQELAWYPSARAALGRGGSWRRQPGDSYYVSPSDYGV